MKHLPKVRINDLAAPQTARDPFLFLEPFVALLIMANAILLGIQTDSCKKVSYWRLAPEASGLGMSSNLLLLSWKYMEWL